MSILEKSKEVAEEIKEKVLGEEPKEESVPEEVPAQPMQENNQSVLSAEPKTYLGKKIIAEKTSVINEKEYITITLEDGSVSQLSEGEYNSHVK